VGRSEEHGPIVDLDLGDAEVVVGLSHYQTGTGGEAGDADGRGFGVERHGAVVDGRALELEAAAVESDGAGHEVVGYLDQAGHRAGDGHGGAALGADLQAQAAVALRHDAGTDWSVVRGYEVTERHLEEVASGDVVMPVGRDDQHEVEDGVGR